LNLVPLKRVAQITAGQSPPSSVVSDLDGTELPFLQGNAEFGERHPSARLQCDLAPKKAERGDILLSVRAPVGALNTADRRYGIGRGLCAIRPTSAIEQNFAWWMAVAMAPHLAGAATGSTYDAVTVDDVGALRIPCPPLPTQRAIANYLDRETARIDALIAAKRRMAELVAEEFAAQRDLALTQVPGVAWVPLQRLTDPYRPIVYGIVQAGEEVPDGVPYIKTGDLANFRPDQLSRTSNEIDRAYRRARVFPGDIVIAMRASIGLPIVVPSELPVANLTQGTARIAPRKGVSRRWLFHALRSRAVQEQCDVRAVGTTFRTLNIWDLRRINVPTPPSFANQERLADVLDGAEARADELRVALETQIVLLGERRQALITASITDDTRVPTSA
jgi:type I restriction enzyme, S subunit